MKALFLSPPSFDGFDGGAGSRYQARREVTSFWYPTWLAQPAALVPNAKLMDCPPHDIHIKQCLEEAKNYGHIIIHTSTPSLKNDCKVAEAIKENRPDSKIGFIGAHAAVLPTETLKASKAIDWVARKDQLLLRSFGLQCTAFRKLPLRCPGPPFAPLPTVNARAPLDARHSLACARWQ